MARLLGLFNKERLASEISAVTRVIIILHTDIHTDVDTSVYHTHSLKETEAKESHKTISDRKLTVVGNGTSIRFHMS